MTGIRETSSPGWTRPPYSASRHHYGRRPSVPARTWTTWRFPGCRPSPSWPGRRLRPMTGARSAEGWLPKVHDGRSWASTSTAPKRSPGTYRGRRSGPSWASNPALSSRPDGGSSPAPSTCSTHPADSGPSRSHHAAQSQRSVLCCAGRHRPSLSTGAKLGGAATGTGCLASPDAEVRSRFIRVVGLPQVDGPASPGLGPASPGLSPASPGLGPTSPGLSPVDGRASLGLTPAPPGRALSSALAPRRRGIRALAVVAVVVVTVAATLAWWSRPRIEAVPAVTRPTGPPASEASTVIVVAVAGRVVRPGLVRLPAGSRVADAIEAAGGVLPGTDLSYVNLARKLTDGELIVIGGTPPPGDAGGAAPPGGPVNLNTATLAQLDALPGVGPVLAARIIDYRTKHGGFRSVAELRQVPGVGDATFEQLKGLVTV